MIRLFEAFSGYGSQELAAELYGIEHESVGIAEIEPDAIIAYGALRFADIPFGYPSVEEMREELIGCDVGYDFKKGKSRIPRMPVKKLKLLYRYHVLSENVGNVAKVRVEDIPEHDLFTYSFPCQDISNAGLMLGLERGSGTRSSLLWECERIIEGVRPKYLMMENVKNLIGKKNRPDFDKWLQVLENLGYNNYVDVINAKDCGVPQNRKRVFCVSIRRDVDFGQFKFLEPFDNGVRLKDLLEEEVDEKYYMLSEKAQSLIEHISKSTILIDSSMIGFEGKPREYSEYMPTITAREYKEPRLVKVKENTIKGYKEAYPGDSIDLSQPNSTTRRGRVGSQVAQTLTTGCSQAVMEPGLRMAGMLDMKGNECVRRVYDPDGVSPTLTSMEGGHRQPKIVEEYRIRKLTPKECLRLMGLPDEKIDLMMAAGLSNSALYKLAGNSIVIQCMQFLKNLELPDGLEDIL